MQAKASVGRELLRFFQESEDILENFEGFDELLERRLTELLRNDLTEGLEGYLRWMKKRADNISLANETDKNMCVCFIKGKKGYNIYPIHRIALPNNFDIVLLYDEFERIVNAAIDDVQNGRADHSLRLSVEKLVYDLAESDINQWVGGAEPKNV
ncbi:MAG: hypothetical protein ABSB40_11700 [Nitrososphaeria archaeon]